MWTSDDDSETDVHAPQGCQMVSQPVYYFLLLLLFWKAAFRVSASSTVFIVKCIKYFVKLLGSAYNCAKIVEASEQIPVTLMSVEKIIGLEKKCFIEYVVCPQCSVIYEFSDCVRTLANGKTESKTCRHVATPNHPHVRKRKACGALLLKQQRRHKKCILAPIKVYPYRSLKKSLCHILSKPDYIEKCEQWRSRMAVLANDILADIYDGQVWKQFTEVELNRFLDTPHSYLLTMNVDWFQPYKRSIYSTGAIYLTLQNLPREDTRM